MLSLQIRRATAVLALAAASILIPLADLHAAPREGARKEKQKPIKVQLEQTPLLGRVISAIWEAAGLRIDDNGFVKDIRDAAGLRIDDNG